MILILILILRGRYHHLPKMTADNLASHQLLMETITPIISDAPDPARILASYPTGTGTGAATGSRSRPEPISNTASAATMHSNPDRMKASR